MQRPTLNRIAQGQHLASKAVDYADDPDPTAYAPEDATIVSYGQQGKPGTQNDAGNALQFRGATGLHQFAHLEKSYVKVGQKVKRGQPLAKMGFTGYTIPSGPAGAHLHYWVLTPNGYVYPENLYNEDFIKSGGKEDMINNKDVANSLFRMYLGRGISDKEWNIWRGGSHDRLIMTLEQNNKEHNRRLEIIKKGEIAVRDNWEGQIHRLVSKVRELEAGQAVTQPEINALAKQADDLEQAIKNVNK